MASVTTSEFVKASGRASAPPFSLIEHKGLAARLGEELSRAASEFARDPRGFIQDIFSAETKDEKRRRLLYIGFVCGALAQVALAVVIVVAGWHRMADVRESTSNKEPITWVNPPEGVKKPNEPAGVSKTEAPRGNGGGGGGQNSMLQASKGVAPIRLPQPQVVALDAPNVSSPALPVNPSIVGPETPPPPPDAAIGDPKGKGTEPSGGRGTGGGIGEGVGTGVGSDKGAGEGPGNIAGKGGGNPGSPNGTGEPRTSYSYNMFRSVPGNAPFKWKYRPTPVVTPEAQANKVIGTVLFRATFRADGRVTDVEVINPVPYMTESARDALMRSTFYPATINGIPITLYNVPVRIDVHY